MAEHSSGRSREHTTHRLDACTGVLANRLMVDEGRAKVSDVVCGAYSLVLAGASVVLSWKPKQCACTAVLLTAKLVAGHGRVTNRI